MEKKKVYERAFFSEEVIRQAAKVFRNRLGDDKQGRTSKMSVETPQGRWTHDKIEEFFGDYRNYPDRAYFSMSYIGAGFSVSTYPSTGSDVDVELPKRSDIEAVFGVFDEHAPRATRPKPEPVKQAPTVFIGHGGNPQWRDLKDHLQDHHGHDVVVYEVGARAGHTIRDILEDMLSKSSFAILVMTAEDEDAQGRFHARANVIHELGLFQGKLGFTRAVALLEGGTEEFSNIHGIHQIRFGKGNIKETFGEVLATLRREFGTVS